MPHFESVSTGQSKELDNNDNSAAFSGCCHLSGLAPVSGAGGRWGAPAARSQVQVARHRTGPVHGQEPPSRTKKAQETVRNSCNNQTTLC